MQLVATAELDTALRKVVDGAGGARGGESAPLRVFRALVYICRRDVQQEDKENLDAELAHACPLFHAVLQLYEHLKLKLKPWRGSEAARAERVDVLLESFVPEARVSRDELDLVLACMAHVCMLRLVDGVEHATVPYVSFCDDWADFFVWERKRREVGNRRERQKRRRRETDRSGAKTGVDSSVEPAAEPAAEPDVEADVEPAAEPPALPLESLAVVATGL